MISPIRTALLTFALSVFSFHACATPFLLSGSKGDEEHYSGQVTLSGSYEEYEDGDLCFVPDKSITKNIPYAKKSVRICFSNEKEALVALKLKDAVSSIDVKSVCGIKGRATVIITDLFTGVGPSERWYTARLVQASKVSRHTKVACRG